MDIHGAGPEHERYKSLLQGKYYTQSNLPDATGYADVIKYQREVLMSKLHDPSNAGPNPLKDLKHLIPRPKIYQTYSDPGMSRGVIRPNYLAMT